MNLPFRADWRSYLQRVVHFVHHWAKKIFVAVVLAVLADIAIDRYENVEEAPATSRGPVSHRCYVNVRLDLQYARAEPSLRNERTLAAFWVRFDLE